MANGTPRDGDGATVSGTSPFPTLFSPFSIGGMTLRNRIVMTAMGSRLSQDGLVGEADVAWLEDRARGGVGLIVTGGQMPAPSAGFGRIAGQSGNSSGLVEAYRDDGIAGQRERVDAVHRHDARIVAQLVHPGREALARAGTLGEAVAVAPSGVPTPGGSDLPHALSAQEIGDIVRWFGHSAENLQAAGVDGIEIHAAHGYLIAQFLSPLTNHRHDDYGMGSIDDRGRFLLEILSEVRARCGRGLVIGVRLSAEEEVPGGITLDDTLAIVERLSATRQVDYLSVTVGMRGNYVKDHTAPLGVAVRHAATIKAATTLPVIVAGRITTPTQAERILESGAADLVGMGRGTDCRPPLSHEGGIGVGGIDQAVHRVRAGLPAISRWGVVRGQCHSKQGAGLVGVRRELRSFANADRRRRSWSRRARGGPGGGRAWPQRRPLREREGTGGPGSSGGALAAPGRDG